MPRRTFRTVASPGGGDATLARVCVPGVAAALTAAERVGAGRGEVKALLAPSPAVGGAGGWGRRVNFISAAGAVGSAGTEGGRDFSGESGSFWEALTAWPGSILIICVRRAGMWAVMTESGSTAGRSAAGRAGRMAGGAGGMGNVAEAREATETERVAGEAWTGSSGAVFPGSPGSVFSGSSLSVLVSGRSDLGEAESGDGREMASCGGVIFSSGSGVGSSVGEESRSGSSVVEGRRVRRRKTGAGSTWTGLAGGCGGAILLRVGSGGAIFGAAGSERGRFGDRQRAGGGAGRKAEGAAGNGLAAGTARTGFFSGSCDVRAMICERSPRAGPAAGGVGPRRVPLFRPGLEREEVRGVTRAAARWRA